MWLLACAAQTADTGTLAPQPQPLSEAAVLRRASLDLRGRPPTRSELRAVTADPEALESLLDDFVLDPEFGTQVMNRHELTYGTRIDQFVVGVDGDYDLFTDASVRRTFTSAVGQEPLRMLERIANDDRPYTELVTADWTMSTPRLAESWPIEALEEPQQGWMMARYTDERPHAGVLATNGMWWRYTSTSENRNRGRAEAIVRIFLCDQRFSASVDFDLAASAAADLQERVFSDENCTGCHVVLEPIASYLWGFWRNHPESFSEAAYYFPGREGLWQTYDAPAPGFYGQPGESLYDLGQQIAADPRFSECAVERGFEGLLGRAPTAQDSEALLTHREAFIQGGLALRPLYRSLVDDPLYRSSDPSFDGTTPRRIMSPALLASQIEALTGFVWTWEGSKMLETDDGGLRLLAGGADGLIAEEPASDYGLTSLLVQQRLAEGAASHAVQRESLASLEERVLFTELEDLSQPQTEQVLGTQITALCWSTWSRGPTERELEELTALWYTLDAQLESSEEAWTMLLSALFRHPDFVEY